MKYITKTIRKEVIRILNYKWGQFEESKEELIAKISSLKDVGEKEKENFINKIEDTDFEKIPKLLEELLEKSKKTYEVINNCDDYDDYNSSITINEILGDKGNNKIYVLSSGEYGENTINGIFTNKRIAKNISNNCIGDIDGSTYIDEFELDEFIELYNKNPFKIRMGYKGHLFECINNKKRSTSLFKEIRERIREDLRMVEFELFANTEQEAIKKCRDRVKELSKKGELYVEK